MTTEKSLFQLIGFYGLEYILTGIFGMIPTSIGKILRNKIYHFIFSHLANVGKIDTQ